LHVLLGRSSRPLLARGPPRAPGRPGPFLEAFGSRLGKVAYRTALRARHAARRRQARLGERLPPQVDTPGPAELLARQEIGPALEEVIRRLPE